MNKRSLTLALVATAALGLVACNKGANSQNAAAKEDSKPPVALVNGKPISAKAYEVWIEGMTQKKPEELTQEQRKQALDALVSIYLAAEEGEKQGLAKEPETAARLELDRRQALANALIQSKMKANAPTDETLKSEYDKLVADGTLQERKVRHILVPTEDAAKRVIAQLDKDASFDALAKKLSTDGGSKNQGGDLGWLGGPDLGRMVPEFSAAVRQLQKGETTKTPVKSQFGYHVIQVEDSRSVPLEQIKPQLSQMVQQKQMREYIDGLKKSAKVEEKLPPEPAAPKAAEAPAGGAPAPGAAPAAPPAEAPKP